MSTTQLGSSPVASDLSQAVNYLIANLSSGTGGDVTSNPTTGQITDNENNILGYLYQYMAVRYADSLDGTVNFNYLPANRLYFGLRNSSFIAPSNNPSDYLWTPVTDGFGTTKNLWYQVIGNRNIKFQVSDTFPGVPWMPAPVSATQSIDLDSIGGVNGSSVFYIGVYQRATSKPDAPMGGYYDFQTNSLTPPPGWYNDAPVGSDTVWVTYNTFVGTNTTVSPVNATWSDPIVLGSSSGPPGLSTYAWTIYQASSTMPVTPVGGSFTFGNPNIGMPPPGWFNSPQTGINWISTTQAQIQGITGTYIVPAGGWSTPVRISGEDGVSAIDIKVDVRLTPTDFNTDPMTWVVDPTGVFFRNDQGANKVLVATLYRGGVPDSFALHSTYQYTWNKNGLPFTPSIPQSLNNRYLLISFTDVNEQSDNFFCVITTP